MNDTTYLAREKALSILQSFEPKPTSLISYQSNGRVLVLGDEAALKNCRQFAEPLVITSLIMAAKTTLPGDIALAGRKIEIRGYLGRFEITLADKQGAEQVVPADIVLDLNPRPLIGLEIPPPGYLHVPPGEFDVQQVEAQLQEMTGEFEKPRFFNYDASICAHGVNGVTVCTQCIDACPAGAIHSLVEKIEVVPQLCQGGGVCATVCPSGAIQYAYPRLTDSGNLLRKMLQAYHEQGGQDAVIVFYSAEDFPKELLQGRGSVLPFKVEELAAVGMDLCVSALAYGASQVVLLADEQVPASALQNLQRQLDWLHPLLEGLDIPPQRVTLADRPDAILWQAEPWLIEAALYAMPGNKRDALFLAIDHLYQQRGKVRELVELPAGAPFGKASIDENRCTLCMACVGACPGKALQDGSNRELPEVFFIESHCLQCGACTQTCPEDAISISPRIIFDREKRNRSRVLNQDVPFACVSCGKPFAPTTVIHKMTDKLKHHHMFQSSRALNRLKMCDDCRVADIVQDPAAMNGNFDAHIPDND